jgi:hypothetical protein
MPTKQQITELLREESPDTILELLEISADELVDTFYDKIEERIDYLRKQYEA